MLTKLCDFPEFVEKIANWEFFFPPANKAMDGRSLQANSLFGRILSVTAWPTDNPWIREDRLGNLLKTSEGGLSKLTDNMATEFHSLIDSLSKFIKKLMKTAETKKKILLWLRTIIKLNLDYHKMQPNIQAISSVGFIIMLESLLMELCYPFTKKLQDYPKFFAKMQTEYCDSPDTIGI